jgi:hypothetical protein
VNTPLTPHSYTGDTASTVSPSSDRSLTSKSLGNSDDDLVLISSMEVNSDPPRVLGVIVSDSLPIAHSGSIEMKKVGGSASASSNRRAAVEQDLPPPQSQSQSVMKESDVSEVQDIDLARSSSDRNKKVQSSDQLYYVNEVRLTWTEYRKNDYWPLIFITSTLSNHFFFSASLRLSSLFFSLPSLPFASLLFSVYLLSHSCILRWMS